MTQFSVTVLDPSLKKYHNQTDVNKRPNSLSNLKPSLSMKILSINNFTIKLLSKLLTNLCIVVHLKGNKKFGSKVSNRQFFHRKTVFVLRYCLLLTLLPNFLVSKTTL